MHELVILAFVTGLAVGRGDGGVDDEAVVVRAGLSLEHLMAVQACDAFYRVLAHLVFVNNGILIVAMTFGAFAAGFDEVRIGLLDFNGRPF